MKFKNEINENESTNEKLVVDTSIKFDKPIEYVEVTIGKPEGMTDEQFMIFVKHLQEQIENYDIHEGELTS